MLNLGSAVALNPAGSIPSTDFRLHILAHTGSPFWVTFGAPFTDEVPCAGITFKNLSVSATAKTWPDAFAAGLVDSTALGFNASTGQCYTAGASQYLPQSTTLKPWDGYWLFVKRPEALTITFPRP